MNQSSGTKRSKSRDLTAIAIWDIWNSVNLLRKSSLFWLVVWEIGIAIRMAIWTEVQITNRAIWKCDLSCSRQRFRGNSCDLGSRDFRSQLFAICDLEHLDQEPPKGQLSSGGLAARKHWSATDEDDESSFVASLHLVACVCSFPHWKPKRAPLTLIALVFHIFLKSFRQNPCTPPGRCWDYSWLRWTKLMKLD